MRSAAVVVLDPFTQDPPGMGFTEWDDVIETFAPHCANQPLTMSIGLRRPRRRLQDVKAETSQALVERGREDRVAIMDEVAVVVLRETAEASTVQWDAR